MRYLLIVGLALLIVRPAAAIDPESKTPYDLRLVVRTGDHPALTSHFRAEVTKAVTSALQAALGTLGTVEAVDLNTLPADKHDALLRLVAERGLESLDGVTAAYGPKTHFVFVDFADNKYEIRTRQHDGSTGFVTPFVRRTVHGDRGFVGRLAGLAVAQDFGIVGTFDPTGPDVAVVLKAGESGPLDAWVKKGDVFAVVQVREARRTGRPPTKTKDGKDPPPAAVGSRLDGVLLHVIDGPRNGVCTCKLHNRYKALPPKDAVTLGYRCVKLGTGEGPLRLQLTDANGAIFNGNTLQPRSGAEDFPDPASRDRGEMLFADGVFTSRERFNQIAFVLVRSGDSPVARIPVEVYPDQIAVRRVSLNNRTESPVVAAAGDLLDRVRNARVIQARAFDELAELQKKEKSKALEYGQAAHDALTKEAEALKADLARLKERYKEDAPPGLFDPSETDLKALEVKSRDLRSHLTRLQDAVRIEKDPATAAARKAIEGLKLEADTARGKADYEEAIAKYEELLRLPSLDALTKDEVARVVDILKKEWEPKDGDHVLARRFVYDVWANLSKPTEIQNALPEARKAVAKCKAVGDKVTLTKMHLTGPVVLQRLGDALDMGELEDEDKRVFQKLIDDLQVLLTELAKELGQDK
jgi:hypothetical protein